MQTEYNNFVKEAAAQAQAVANDVNENTRRVSATYSEVALSASEAAAKASAALSEMVLKTWDANVRTAMEQGSALTGVATPADYFAKQAEFARSNGEQAVAQVQEFSQAWLSAATSVVEPVQAGYSKLTKTS